MRQALDNMAQLLTGGQADAETLDWSALRFQHTAAIRSRLAEEYAPATVNKHLSALRGVLKAAWRLGYMSAEEYQRAADVEGVSGSTLPAGRHITPGELSALLSVCRDDPRPAGARDAAIIAVLYAAGLRRAELVALDLADYNTQDLSLTVRAGKGHKARITYVERGAGEALEDWLYFRDTEPGPLFTRIDKGDRVTLERLTPQAVYFILGERCEQAGVDPLSPHDFRRTFVSDLLDAGVDLATVSKLAGHEQVETTRRYDRRGEEAKREAVKRLHVPYRRRRC